MPDDAEIAAAHQTGCQQPRVHTGFLDSTAFCGDDAQRATHTTWRSDKIKRVVMFGQGYYDLLKNATAVASTKSKLRY